MKNKYTNWYSYRVVYTPALVPGTSPAKETNYLGPGHIAREGSETALCSEKWNKDKYAKKTTALRNIEMCVKCTKQFKNLEYPPVG